MTPGEFRAIAPMFASEDETRPSLRKPFVCGGCMFASDGRIALMLRASRGLACTDDERRRFCAKSIVDMVADYDAKVAGGKYARYDLCRISEAVVASFADVEPQVMWLRANEPDEADPDDDCSLDSVRYVHTWFTAVIMPNAVRSVISGYNASLVAGLAKYHTPVEAYADASDPNTPLYFRGSNWNCVVMPIRADGGCFATAIADAKTGKLVWSYVNPDYPDVDALRKCGQS